MASILTAFSKKRWDWQMAEEIGVDTANRAVQPPPVVNVTLVLVQTNVRTGARQIQTCKQVQPVAGPDPTQKIWPRQTKQTANQKCFFGKK